jgi:CubicO group peptidase (beta-lactamase class C family)
MTANKMVGVSVGIVKDGNIYMAKGYGMADAGKATPVDSLTNFLTCSITKLFTATAIMQLAGQGKIDINEKLIFYLPDFKMKDSRHKDITIRHLLTHSSGLYWDMELKQSPNDSTALQKLVYSLYDKVLDFAPGTQFDATKTYSNAAYDILGYLVQKISGKQYDVYIKEAILNKVGMPYSDIQYTNIDPARRSTPYIIKNKKVVAGGMLTENTEHAPSGNLNSCSIDLCNWMLHILNIANMDTVGVLQPGILKTMWQPVHTAPQNKNVSIGLGWFITTSKDYGTYYWHVGDNPGFSSTLMVFPQQNLGITVLSNGMYAQDIVWNKIPYGILQLCR